MIDNSNHHRRRAGRFGGIDCNNIAGLLKEHIQTGFVLLLSVCMQTERRYGYLY